MKMGTLFLTLVFAATTLAGTAVAQDKKEPKGDRQQKESAQQQQQQSLRALDDLDGMTVQNAKGEKLGSISDVLVDVKAGQLGYAVVSSGGILGMGENRYIVPFRALKVEGNSLLLDMPADRFKQAPKGQVEQAFSEDQGRQIHQFYGISPYWEESGSQKRQSDTDSKGGQTQQREEQQPQKY